MHEFWYYTSLHVEIQKVPLTERIKSQQVSSTRQKIFPLTVWVCCKSGLWLPLLVGSLGVSGLGIGSLRVSGLGVGALRVSSLWIGALMVSSLGVWARHKPWACLSEPRLAEAYSLGVRGLAGGLGVVRGGHAEASLGRPIDAVVEGVVLSHDGEGALVLGHGLAGS